VIDLDGLKRDAEAAIEAAFPVGDPPSPAEMRNDHCPECREMAARFTGKAGVDLVLDDVRGNPEPGILTATGFRYYLPAMMRLSMRFPREVDCLPESLIGLLSPKGSTLGQRDAERLTFTPMQANAILAFLRFFELLGKVENTEPGWHAEAILAVPTDRPLERAIRFWKRRASEGAG
jgi:hypothetical protein